MDGCCDIGKPQLLARTLALPIAHPSTHQNLRLNKPSKTDRVQRTIFASKRTTIFCGLFLWHFQLFFSCRRTVITLPAKPVYTCIHLHVGFQISCLSNQSIQYSTCIAYSPWPCYKTSQVTNNDSGISLIADSLPYY